MVFQNDRVQIDNRTKTQNDGVQNDGVQNYGVQIDAM
jgi:hypothetical protein